MKTFVMLLALGLTTSVLASERVIEFDQDQELKCHTEATALGCLKADKEEDLKCLESKKDKLTKECQGMLKSKQASI